MSRYETRNNVNESIWSGHRHTDQTRRLDQTLKDKGVQFIQAPQTVDFAHGEVSMELLLFKVRDSKFLAGNTWGLRGDGHGEDIGAVVTIVGWIVNADPVFTHIASVWDEDDGEFCGGIAVPNACIIEAVRLVVAE